MLPHDYHLHTRFSCDSRAEMAEMCQSAVERGLPEIGFTEHYDLHPAESCRDWFRLEEWALELAACRERFAARLTVRAGVEIGEPHLFAVETQALLAHHPFDYVLGSLHWVGQESIFDLNYFHARSPQAAGDDFFVELERMTRLGGFDILSHLDVIARTAYEAYGEYDVRRHQDLIRPVLRNCVEHGIALDLNTAILRRRAVRGRLPAEVLTPNQDVLRWYVELGGERVCLGSDAHRPDQVGLGLQAAAAMAQAAGLKYVTHFEQRQARLQLWPENR